MMIWPFKKKDKFIKSTGRAVTDYNKLRASVGMAPASDDVYCEAVAWVVVYDLLAPEVADECKCLPVDERGLFMMVYATYLSWLAMKVVESKFPPESWGRISLMLQREFSKQSWYRPEIMKRLLDSMVEYPPIGKRTGRHFNISLGPWHDAVMATNLAGFKLENSTNTKFILYIVIMSGKIVETIAKMAPAG
jgi:hypothetical protein